jgi:drug/metabolite transporter (DMT)-like permease
VRPLVQVAVAATGWGTWSLFLRPAAVDARWSSAIMLTVVALACMPLLLRRAARGPSEGRSRTARDWWAIVFLGIFDAGNAGLFFAAMSVTSVAVAVLSHYLAPVFVAAAAPFALGTERRRGATALALAALFGLALVLEPWHLAPANVSAGRPLLGAALGAGSAVFYAVNVLITKRIGPRFTAEEQLGYHSILSAAILALLAVVQHAPLPTTSGLLLVAAGGVLVGATSGLLFLYGLKRITAEQAGILTFLEPLSAVLIAWGAWGERPGAAALLGGVIVLVAGALAVRERGAPVAMAAAEASSTPP